MHVSLSCSFLHWESYISLFLKCPKGGLRVTWWALAAQGGCALTEHCDTLRWSRMLQAPCWSEHDTARMASFDDLLVTQSCTFFHGAKKGRQLGEREGGVWCAKMHSCMSHDEQKKKNNNRETWTHRDKRMRKVLGEGRTQRPLKCEFSAARETSVALLLVIGLAPIPKLPPPLLSIYCFPIQSRSPPSLFPSHPPLSPCRPTPVYSAVSRALLEHGGAWGMVLADIAASGRLLWGIDWGWGVKRVGE